MQFQLPQNVPQNPVTDVKPPFWEGQEIDPENSKVVFFDLVISEPEILEKSGALFATTTTSVIVSEGNKFVEPEAKEAPSGNLGRAIADKVFNPIEWQKPAQGRVPEARANPPGEKVDSRGENPNGQNEKLSQGNSEPNPDIGNPPLPSQPGSMTWVAVTPKTPVEAPDGQPRSSVNESPGPALKTSGSPGQRPLYRSQDSEAANLVGPTETMPEKINSAPVLLTAPEMRTADQTAMQEPSVLQSGWQTSKVSDVTQQEIRSSEQPTQVAPEGGINWPGHTESSREGGNSLPVEAVEDTRPETITKGLARGEISDAGPREPPRVFGNKKARQNVPSPVVSEPPDAPRNAVTPSESPERREQKPEVGGGINAADSENVLARTRQTDTTQADFAGFDSRPADKTPSPFPTAVDVANTVQFEKLDISEMQERVDLRPPETSVRDVLPSKPDATLFRSEMARQISQQLTDSLGSRPGAPVEIYLEREELGKVRMTISSSDSAISVSILADRPETIELMRRHIDTLSGEFRNIGYADVKFDFGQGQPRQEIPDANRQRFDASGAADLPELPVQISLGPRQGMDIRL